MAPPKAKPSPTKADADKKPNQRKKETKAFGSEEVQFLVDLLEQTKELSGKPINFPAIADKYKITKNATRLRYKYIKDRLEKQKDEGDKETEKEAEQLTEGATDEETED